MRKWVGEWSEGSVRNDRQVVSGGRPDFDSIIAYLQEQNPSAADRVARTIYSTVSSLNTFPERARIGRVEGTRELLLAPLPYIVVYRGLGDVVEIARLLHGAQRWPQR